jgi:NADH-quinone oxidoreductase subunit C
MSEAKPDLLDEQAAAVAARFGDAVRRVESRCGELGFEVASAQLRAVGAALRDEPEFRYEQLVDLTGVDYLEFGKVEWNTSNATRSGFSRGVNRGAEAAGPADERRFAVVYHLQSVSLNRRLRLRAWCEAGEPPQVDSVIDLWSSADWYEREAFDLFGIVFRGHPDLRRLLTDYGFVGHPFRKDFPLIGNVEVRFDPGKGRVVYEPVSIEPRTLVPRVIREDNRYEPALKDPPRKDATHG